MAMQPPTRPPLTPRYWPGWLAVGLFWLLGKTPQAVGLALAGPLGALMRTLMGRRRRVAERNIERCFPEYSAAQRERLLRDSFRSLARMLFEIPWSWSASERRIRRMGHIEGLEPALAALAEGRGVLLVTAHLTCLEIGARILSVVFPKSAGVYRPLRSPVLEWYQTRSRLRYADCLISKRDMRTAIRFLREGGAVWYAPDQDFGAKQSVFVPFFGIQTATLLATERLVRLTNCAVIPMFPLYDEKQRHYTVLLGEPLQDFPSGDPIADLSRINALMEAHVRRVPEQYWWVHRRFKTRPAGEPPFYD